MATKHYTLQDAASALGIDEMTLHSWLENFPHEAYTDPRDHQLYVLDEGQLEQLARAHNLPVKLEQVGEVNVGQKRIAEIEPMQLSGSTIAIGRFRNNNLVLNHPQVSGYHARLEQLNTGGYRIVDLGSTNGTYVNMQRVRTRILNPGDIIGIGPYQMTYTGNQLVQQDSSYSIRIDALHLSSTGHRHVLLLHDISLDIPARTFVALVGGSGVGKSTLLNALSGLKPAQKGTVLYNGQDYYKNLGAFNTQIGYVPQDDIVHKDLTVQQALYYTAKMRLPGDFTRAQIKERINEVLEEVEMSHRRKHMVSSLSGGERKRVSIALELLANPSVFFLDEPTSGLDPGLDRKMMQLLRKLTNKGHTIVLVTHATTNIHYCDLVCFLSQGGRLAFYGTPTEAQAYFGTTDYAEIYNALEPADDHPKASEEAEERYKQSPYYQRYVVEPLNRELTQYDQAAMATRMLMSRPKRGRPWKQFFLLSRRYLRLLVNDFVSFIILILQAPIIGLILYYLAGKGTFDNTSITACPIHADPVNMTGPIVSLDCQKVVDLLKSPQGILYAQAHHMTLDQILQQAIAPNSGANAQTLLFIMAFAAVLFGTLNGVRAIVREIPIYRRERMVNLGLIPYMFSKIIILGILSLFQSAVLVYFVNLKTPFHGGIILPVLWEIYITMALTNLAGLMLGLMISALAPSTDRAMSLVPLVLIPQVIFSGIIFMLNTPVLQIIGGLFAARWGMAGLGSTVGLHGDKLGVDNWTYQGTHFASLSQAVEQQAATTHLFIIWGALLGLIIVQGILTAYFLKKKDPIK
ncbi:MAG TPA: ATP-binding cassette domain-containing protein [Ktedonobacteraceae bacterium]|jgi:ABC-type multidrug transport system ATPase subunit|nr:ATP-binding cassette domain-containing protein [Ktedonobacteraceae bacterium]